MLSSGRRKFKLWPSNVSVLSSGRRKLKLRPPRDSVLSSGRRKFKLWPPKCQCAEFREKEAQAKATERQCPEFRAKEMHAMKQNRIRRGCTPTTIIQASEAFIRATKEGPDYICICCNRLMYRKTVIEFKLTKYNKTPEDFSAAASSGTKQWICKTCDHALKRGKLPAQAKANNLHVPPELSDLNPLEVSSYLQLVSSPMTTSVRLHLNLSVAAAS